MLFLSISFLSPAVVVVPAVSSFVLRKSSSNGMAIIKRNRLLLSSSTLSSSSSSSSDLSQEQKQKSRNILTTNNDRSNTKTAITSSNTGGLRRFPVVKAPKELKDKALKMSRYVKPDVTLKNVRNRARKHGAETLNELTNSLCIPLRDLVNGYKREWRRLHPFERVVADLTVRARQRKDGLILNDVLDDINESRKIILETGKEYVARAKHAPTAKEASNAIFEGTNKLIELFDVLASEPVTGIITLQKSLRSAPIIQLNTPAVVLVGAPNVGKSSIVRKISSGTPEINNYPFTTRGMTLGHVQVFWGTTSTSTANADDTSKTNDNADNIVIKKAVVPENDDNLKRKINSKSSSFEEGQYYAFSQLCQVMDTPGLLVRETDNDRNEMESLTMAAMQHLPTAVIYVIDLSGQAGDKFSSIKDQLQLRREVRKRFPRRPWVDVVSKIDINVDDEGLQELEEILNGSKYIKLSSHTGEGIDELRKDVLRMLGEVRVVLDAISSSPAASP